MDERVFGNFIVNIMPFIEEGLILKEREFNCGYGVVDLFCQDKRNNFVIIELKIKGDSSAIGQLLKYQIAIEDKFNQPIRLMLIARYVPDPIKRVCDRLGIEYREIKYGNKLGNLIYKEYCHRLQLKTNDPFDILLNGINKREH